MSADIGATEASGADDTVADPPAKNPWGALALLSLGVAMIIVDGTVVNVALPSMIKDLDMTFADAEWVNTIYALVFAALLINFGRLADIRGRKLLFLTGIVIFVGASMFAGQSDSAHNSFSPDSSRGSALRSSCPPPCPQ